MSEKNVYLISETEVEMVPEDSLKFDNFIRAGKECRIALSPNVDLVLREYIESLKADASLYERIYTVEDFHHRRTVGMVLGAGLWTRIKYLFTGDFDFFVE